MATWRFPKTGGNHQIILIFVLHFPLPSSYWATPMTMETPIWGVLKMEDPQNHEFMSFNTQYDRILNDLGRPPV